MDDGPVGALRVNQLDASELDQDLLHLTKAQVSQIFKYHKTGFLSRFDPEINAGIKLILWKLSLYDGGSTVGQRILGLHYGQAGEGSSGSAIGVREKILYGLLVVLCPWLRERLATLLHYMKLSGIVDEVEWWLQKTETVLKVAAVFNLMVFLRQGVFLSLVERMLGVRTLLPRRQGLRQVGFEFMTRELLWHGFSEFLFFLLPLINFQRAKNTVMRWVKGHKVGGEGHLGQRVKADLMTCGVCGEWPVAPREVGCRHVFCYYCVMAHLKADPHLCCPQCGHPVVSPANVQPVRTHINPGQV